jgi:hypothetical protein
MTAIIISSILVIGIVSALVQYIPKSWIKKHIVAEVDPDDTRF